MSAVPIVNGRAENAILLNAVPALNRPPHLLPAAGLAASEIGLEPTLRTSGPLPRGAWIVNGSGIALEVPDKLLVLPALLKCWEADLLVELHRFCHFADMQRVGSQFVQRHRWFPFIDASRGDSATTPQSCPTLPASG
jgi:hypothetical protein